MSALIALIIGATVLAICWLSRRARQAAHAGERLASRLCDLERGGRDA